MGPTCRLEALENRTFLSAGLVAAYGFDEGAGTTVADLSGNGNAGSITGATWSTSGKFGKALSFNGTGNVVVVNDSNSLDLTTGMTLEAWVRPTSSSGYRTVLMKEVPGELSYSLYSSGDVNRPSAWARVGTTSSDATGTAAVPLNAWTHLAATFDGSVLTLFVNGASVKTRSISGSIVTSANALRIGGNSVWGEYFAGLIDEVRVYNRPLAAAEIQADMNVAVQPATPDTTAPTVSVTSPAAGANVSSTFQLTASAADNVGVAGVQFKLDGVNLGAEDTAAPFSLNWDTTAASLGAHTITAVARDAAGNVATSSPVAVTVVDVTVPSVALTAPAGGATVAGTVTVTATASDDRAVAGVQFLLNGSPLGAEDTSAPYAVAWDTVAGPAGSYQLTAVARDASGNTTTSAPVSVTVDNRVDSAPPSVSLTAPAAGATVTGTVSVTANASDDIAVVGVQFLLDGAGLGAEDTSAPYGVSWNSSAATPGTHTLAAVARDAAGHSTTSSAVSVTVSNPVPSGLVAAYGFNEGAGTTAADASGSGNTGAVAGATWAAAGKFGGALSFNGSNAIVNVADSNSLDLTTGMTLEAWVRPSSQSGYRTVMMKDVAGELSYTLYGSGDTAAPNAWARVGGTSRDATATTAVPLNAWSHLAATYTGTTLLLFVNGVQVASKTAAGSIQTSANPFHIGGNAVWGEYFAGLIDEVRVYNRALTAGEIQSDMATPIGAAAPPDTTAPTAAITAPAAGSTLLGSVTVTATASDDVAVAGVQFKLNGVNLGAEDTTAPYSVVWDTTASANGTYQLTAVARDAAGNTGTSAIVSVTVANTTSDTTAPTVSLTVPAAGAIISAQTAVSASASDNVGVAGVQFLLDGQPLGAEDTAAPYSITWDTTGASNGPHTLAARARDAAGNVATSTSRSVTVANNVADPAVVGQWSSMIDLPIVAMNMVLLDDGKILMYDGGPDCIGATSATLWDLTTNTFKPVPSETVQHVRDIFCSAMTALSDGRILVVGGHECDDPSFLGTAIAQIFDPVTETWSKLPNMSYRRWYPTATTLPDGRALVTAGSDVSTTSYIPIPEVYNPVTNTFTKLTTANQVIPNYPFMFVLPDGRVLAAGSDEAKMATYALNMSTQTWSVVDPTILDAGSAVMYLPGKVMKAGSSYLSPPADNGGSVPSKNTTYVLDMTSATPAWQQTASMQYARTHLNLTLLPDGNVFANGGSSDIGGVNTASAVYPGEMWSPATRTWTTMASAAGHRMYHSTATLLPDGRVVTAGSGHNYFNSLAAFNAEIYSPAYLFKGSRPTITSSPDTLRYNSSFFVGTPDGASIASVSLICNGSVTHAFNMDQRFVPLTFQQTAGGLTVQAPPDANTAPPGTYMLFIVNSNGVPSVAPFVRFPAGYEDSQAPTAPTNLTANGSLGQAALGWSAATDNVGVTKYNVYRSTVLGFTPDVQNLIGSSASTGYTDAGVPAGTYYYAVRAVDAAGNIGPSSNQAAATVTSDTTPPTVAVTAPAAGATVFGIVSINASASDNVGVAGVQFLLDGAAIGAEDTAAPFSFSWNTAPVSNGPHVITAVARDPSGNTATSAPVSVTVSNSGPAGLVAAYGFNEGAGTTASDSSGLGNTGTVSGAVWSAAGKFGGALSFNGTNAIVDVADSDSLDLTTGMTLEAWVRPTSQSGYRTVVMKDVPGELSYTLYASGGGTAPSGWVRTGGTSKDTTGSSGLALNTWSHLAATYNGASLALYVNGALAASKAVSGSIQASANLFHIGGNGVWGEYFAGLIDEVRVYSRALTAAEIQTDMNTAVGPAAGSAIGLASIGPVLAAPTTTTTASDGVTDPATALVATRKRGSRRVLYLGTCPAFGATPS